MGYDNKYYFHTENINKYQPSTTQWPNLSMPGSSLPSSFPGVNGTLDIFQQITNSTIYDYSQQQVLDSQLKKKDLVTSIVPQIETINFSRDLMQSEYNLKSYMASKPHLWKMATMDDVLENAAYSPLMLVKPNQTLIIQLLATSNDNKDGYNLELYHFEVGDDITIDNFYQMLENELYGDDNQIDQQKLKDYKEQTLTPDLFINSCQLINTTKHNIIVCAKCYGVTGRLVDKNNTLLTFVNGLPMSNIQIKAETTPKIYAFFSREFAEVDEDGRVISIGETRLENAGGQLVIDEIPNSDKWIPGVDFHSLEMIKEMVAKTNPIYEFKETSDRGVDFIIERPNALYNDRRFLKGLEYYNLKLVLLPYRNRTGGDGAYPRRYNGNIYSVSDSLVRCIQITTASKGTDWRCMIQDRVANVIQAPFVNAGRQLKGIVLSKEEKEKRRIPTRYEDYPDKESGSRIYYNTKTVVVNETTSCRDEENMTLIRKLGGCNPAGGIGGFIQVYFKWVLIKSNKIIDDKTNTEIVKTSYPGMTLKIDSKLVGHRMPIDTDLDSINQFHLNKPAYNGKDSVVSKIHNKMYVTGSDVYFNTDGKIYYSNIDHELTSIDLKAGKKQKLSDIECGDKYKNFIFKFNDDEEDYVNFKL